MSITDRFIPAAAIVRHDIPRRGLARDDLLLFSAWARTKKNATEGTTYALPVVGWESANDTDAVCLYRHGDRLQVFPQGDPALRYLFTEATAEEYAEAYAERRENGEDDEDDY